MLRHVSWINLTCKGALHIPCDAVDPWTGHLQTNQPSDGSAVRVVEPRAAISEYRFRSELTGILTIVVVADSADRTREELARIRLHPSFFELLGEE